MVVDLRRPDRVSLTIPTLDICRQPLPRSVANDIGDVDSQETSDIFRRAEFDHTDIDKHQHRGRRQFVPFSAGDMIIQGMGKPDFKVFLSAAIFSDTLNFDPDKTKYLQEAEHHVQTFMDNVKGDFQDMPMTIMFDTGATTLQEMAPASTAGIKVF